jgi:hypothetical protein
MPWIPFLKLTISSPLGLDVVQTRLAEQVEPHKLIRWRSDANTKAYQGTVTSNSFKILRIIGYRNSFLPVIEGTFERKLSKTEITVKMRLHKVVAVFMFLWIGILSTFYVYPMMIGSASKEFPFPLIVIPIGMAVFGYVLTVASFTFEARKSKKFFEELFQPQD